MSEKQATIRYFKIFVPSMAMYLIGMIGISWPAKNLGLPQPALIGLAAIPMIALLCAIWAHWRFITELDEFLRMIQIKGIVFGVAMVLIVASSWGLLEVLAEVPRLPIIHTFTIFCISYGLAVAVLTKLENRANA